MSTIFITMVLHNVLYYYLKQKNADHNH